MYSYEDRIRAVKLYMKLGKRTGATIRQLGYSMISVACSKMVCGNGSLSAPATLRPTAPGSRDLLIWQSAGDTCFDDTWLPAKYPLAIVEWKVHRRGHRNARVDKERGWLQAYCAWQPSVVRYAIEVDGTQVPTRLVCGRFPGSTEDGRWLDLPEEGLSFT